MSEEKNDSDPVALSQNQKEAVQRTKMEKARHHDSVLESVRRNVREGMETAQRNISEGKVTASRNLKEGMETARRNIIEGYHTAELNIRNGADTALRNIAEGAETARRNIGGADFHDGSRQGYNEATRKEEEGQESHHGSASLETQFTDTKTALAPPPSLPPASQPIEAPQDHTHNEIADESLEVKISRLERQIDERGLIGRSDYIS